MKTELLSLTPEELKMQVISLGLPAYRAKQITEWLRRGCRNFEEMTNLPKELREMLPIHFSLPSPVLLRKQISKEDRTEKFLWGLADGNSVETVFMRYHYGNSVCISTQVGCRQGCAFCASTIGGLIRNLTPGEMVDEVLFSEKTAGEKVSNIVLMGIGEPLDNLENVLQFLRIISHPEGRNIGLRHITLSTCGLPEGIERLSREDMPITLAVSLHAPEDQLRSRLMPSNRGIEAVMNACINYYRQTGRRISFEYSMIDGTNDSPDCAEQLAALARRVGAHVNLIPLNYVEERALQPSPPAVIREFQEILEQKGINVSVRRRLGSDIDASCGQLRRKHQTEKQEV